jgi:hypothetical protein
MLVLLPLTSVPIHDSNIDNLRCYSLDPVPESLPRRHRRVRRERKLGHKSNNTDLWIFLHCFDIPHWCWLAGLDFHRGIGHAEI